MPVLTQPAPFLSDSIFRPTTLKADTVLRASSLISNNELEEISLSISFSETQASFLSSSNFLGTITDIGVFLVVLDQGISESIFRETALMIEESVISTPGVFESGSQLIPAEHNIEGGIIIPIDSPFETESIFKDVTVSGGEGVIINVSNPIISNSILKGTTLKFNIIEFMGTGDDVYLLIKDELDKFKVYKGKIRGMNPRDRKIKIKAIMGDKILTERIVKENYLEQDIGLTVKDIIETYCAPLTASNVDINTGYSAPIQAEGKKPSQILTELQGKYPVIFYVDFAWDVHFMLESDIEEASEELGGYIIRLGDE